MKLPLFEQAIIPQRKLTNYLLSPTHRKGRDKAAFFARFGFSAESWEMLAFAIREHAAAYDVATMETTPFGTSYTIEGRYCRPTVERRGYALCGLLKRAKQFRIW